MSLSYNIQYQRELAEKLLKSYSNNQNFNTEPKLLFEIVPKDAIKIDGKYYMRNMNNTDGRIWDQPFLDRINSGDQNLRKMELKPLTENHRPSRNSLLKTQNSEFEEEIVGSGVGLTVIEGAVNALVQVIKGVTGHTNREMDSFSDLLIEILGSITGAITPTALSEGFQVGGGVKFGGSHKFSMVLINKAINIMMKTVKPILNISPKLFVIAVRMVKQFVLQALGVLKPGTVLKGKGVFKKVKKAVKSPLGRKVIGRVLDTAIPLVGTVVAQSAGIPAPVGLVSGKILRDVVKAKTGFGAVSKFSKPVLGGGVKGTSTFGEKMARRRAVVNKLQKDKKISFKEASAIVKQQNMKY